MGKLGSFIGAAPRLGMVTYHRYPLRACVTDPSSPGFPSIPNLLADSSSAGLATPMSPFVAARPPPQPPVPRRGDELGLLPGRKGRL